MRRNRPLTCVFGVLALLGASLHIPGLPRANLQILQTGQKPQAIIPDEIDQVQGFAAPVAGRWAYFAELVDGT